MNEPQLLAVAITAEEEDARIYRDFAERLRADFHPRRAAWLLAALTPEQARNEAARRLFVLRFVQPGLAGLIVGGVLVFPAGWFIGTG